MGRTGLGPGPGRSRSCRVAHALVLLTSLYHLAGTRLIAVPLSVGTIVTSGFAFGYLSFLDGQRVRPLTTPNSADNPGLGRSEKGRTRRS